MTSTEDDASSSAYRPASKTQTEQLREERERERERVCVFEMRTRRETRHDGNKVVSRAVQQTERARQPKVNQISAVPAKCSTAGEWEGSRLGMAAAPAGGIRPAAPHCTMTTGSMGQDKTVTKCLIFCLSAAAAVFITALLLDLVLRDGAEDGRCGWWGFDLEEEEEEEGEGTE